jgi:hypothetical protein
MRTQSTKPLCHCSLLCPSDMIPNGYSKGQSRVADPRWQRSQASCRTPQTTNFAAVSLWWRLTAGRVAVCQRSSWINHSGPDSQPVEVDDHDDEDAGDNALPERILRVPAFIATLGMLTIVRGAALIYTRGRDIYLFAKPSTRFYQAGSRQPSLPWGSQRCLV